MPSIQLFGGAIQATYPANLTDASDLRQVPDTQEVYLSNDSDLSLILEVLELVKDEGAENDLTAAVKYHYSSLAHDNTALSSSIASISLPSPSPPPSTSTTLPPILGPTTLIGTQVVSKFNKSAEEADTVLILLALWRLPSKDADLVLTVNYPIKKEGKGEEESGEVARAAFEEAVRTLRIQDFGLFAGGDE